MKRILALLLVLVLAFSVFSITSFAEPAEAPETKEYKCYDRFLEFYNVDPRIVNVFLYDEIYCHYTDPDDESTLDWILLQAAFGEGNMMEYKEEIAGRIVCLGNCSRPFVNSYGIYDVKEDKFFGLSKANINQYDGLSEVFASIELHSPVYEGDNTDLPYETARLLSAARAYYRNDSIRASDLVVLYREKLDENRSVMHLMLSTMLYPASMIQREFGRYTMETAQPVPVYFDSEKLIDFDSAYHRGLVSSEEVDALLDVKWLGLTKSATLKGDADCDKKVTVIDATMIQKRLASVVGINAIDSENADVDNDDMVTVIDATLIQKRLAGME